ncbi:MAG: 4Fe-4S binding protein [Bacteroidales bacterium]|nr:4Fe-4S binding protein [Bacteroidales bacterium]
MKKRRFVLTFPPEVVNEPITYILAKEYDVKINILNAKISAGEEGNLLVEMEGTYANLKKGVDYIKNLNVEIEPLIKKIRFKKEDCIDCGACVAVCFAGALFMKKPERKLTFDPDKCIVCELCTKACPLGLFKIDFGDPSDV